MYHLFLWLSAAQHTICTASARATERQWQSIKLSGNALHLNVQGEHVERFALPRSIRADSASTLRQQSYHNMKRRNEKSVKSLAVPWCIAAHTASGVWLCHGASQLTLFPVFECAMAHRSSHHFKNSLHHGASQQPEITK